MSTTKRQPKHSAGLIRTRYHRDTPTCSESSKRLPKHRVGLEHLGPSHVSESGLRARLEVLQNIGSQMFMLRIETLSARDHHLRNSRKKNCRKRGNFKARQSTDWLCATQNGRGTAESFSSLQVAQLTASLLNS